MRLLFSFVAAMIATSGSIHAQQDSSSVAGNPANKIDKVRWKAPALTDENLERWMTYVRPTQEELAWRTKIRWHTSLGTAAREARELNRPILLWTMNGNPCGET